MARRRQRSVSDRAAMAGRQCTYPLCCRVGLPGWRLAVPNLRNYLREALGDAYDLERELPAGGMSRLFLAWVCYATVRRARGALRARGLAGAAGADRRGGSGPARARAESRANAYYRGAVGVIRARRGRGRAPRRVAEYTAGAVPARHPRAAARGDGGRIRRARTGARSASGGDRAGGGPVLLLGAPRAGIRLIPRRPGLRGALSAERLTA